MIEKKKDIKCKYCNTSKKLLSYVQYGKNVICKICIECKSKNISRNNSRFWKGKKRCDKTKEKIRSSLKGNIPWNKGQTKNSNKIIALIGNKNKTSLLKTMNEKEKSRLNSFCEHNVFLSVNNEVGKIVKHRDSPEQSLPEKILFEKIKKLFPSAQTNQRILNKKPDILISKFNLIIEYDGKYFHQDICHDINRDKILINAGFRVLHFYEYIPKNDDLLRTLIYDFILSSDRNRYLICDQCERELW